MRAAVQRSVLWVILSLCFSVVVWRLKGPQHGLDFLTGYLIEYSLSVDNIFVFVLIFAYFRVPPRAQHRVLVWGIVGALVMRGIMIWCGIALVQRFHFVLYLFARLIDRFIYLQTELAVILGFVGIKIIVADYYPISNWISLGVIVLVLAVTITISMIVTERRAAAGNRK